MAVHSLKDLPTFAVAGLTLAAVPERGPVGDVLVSAKFRRFDDLPGGAKLGTGSLAAGLRFFIAGPICTCSTCAAMWKRGCEK